MTLDTLVSTPPILPYHRYASILTRIFMMPSIATTARAAAFAEAEQVTLYARVEDAMADALFGRGVAREVATDFAQKFCQRILADIRSIETEVMRERGLPPVA